MFQPATTLDNISAVGSNLYAFVSGDGLRLMWSRNIGSGEQIVESTRQDLASSFSAPVVHTELGMPLWSPTFSQDGLELFYGFVETGGIAFDIYTARRSALDQPFGNVARVPELSSLRDDTGAHLTPDGKTIYLNYDAVTSGGNAEMYISTRTCL
jgi:hypothetical protein